MKLFIDTADRDNKLIRLDTAEKRFSGDTLGAIDELLREQGKSVQDLTEIEVNKGPGSFTSLREGISVANTLNYLLGLKDVGEMVLPEYGKEPNISKRK